MDDSISATIRTLETLHKFVTDWNVPTQTCVLAHITTQMKALAQKAPVHLLFQSIAGSEAANKAFGISKELLDEAYEMGIKWAALRGPVSCILRPDKVRAIL